MCFPSQTLFVPSYIIDLGKSDPFAIFTLDGQRVFKSQAKKKTVNPEWNETFAVSVVSIIAEQEKRLISDRVQFSRLVLRRTSNLKSLTGISLSRQKAWEPPGSASKKLSPSAV